MQPKAHCTLTDTLSDLGEVLFTSTFCTPWTCAVRSMLKVIFPSTHTDAFFLPHPHPPSSAPSPSDCRFRSELRFQIDLRQEQSVIQKRKREKQRPLLTPSDGQGRRDETRERKKGGERERLPTDLRRRRHFCPSRNLLADKKTFLWLSLVIDRRRRRRRNELCRI